MQHFNYLGSNSAYACGRDIPTKLNKLRHLETKKARILLATGTFSSTISEDLALSKKGISVLQSYEISMTGQKAVVLFVLQWLGAQTIISVNGTA